MTIAASKRPANNQSSEGAHMAQERKVFGLTAALSALVATVPAQADAHVATEAFQKDVPNADAGAIADNDFVLLPATDADGSIYLGHESHASHASHASHRSHHSSR
jgi:hypothetical protein